jgi:hypothetical protein
MSLLSNAAASLAKVAILKGRELLVRSQRDAKFQPKIM